MKRFAVFVAAIGLVVAACGEEGVFDGLGDRAQKAVVGSTTTTIAPDDGVDPGEEAVFISATVPVWYNDGIPDQAIGLPEYTIREVWDRGHDSGRFIQSSRAEIAVALPGIQFPSRVPGEVSWVTSQLVYLEDVANLDAGTSAAFGLWELEPYSSDEGRVAKLTVGATRGDLAPGEVEQEVLTVGLTLRWSDGRYRYELFCRASLPEAQCRELVRTMIPLRNLLPGDLGPQAGASGPPKLG